MDYEHKPSKINSVFEKHPEVENVLLYGSRDKGNYREGSDIDIALKGNNLTEEIRSKISLEIDGLNTPYLFDIAILHHIKNTDLQNHISRVGKKFYQKTVN